MGIENIKDVKFKFDERTKLRAQIGLSIGITLGMAAAFVAIILANMALWYKIFAAFGLFCATSLQLIGVFGAIKALKAYNSAMAEFEKMSAESGSMNNGPQSYHG